VRILGTDSAAVQPPHGWQAVGGEEEVGPALEFSPCGSLSLSPFFFFQKHVEYLVLYCMSQTKSVRKFVHIVRGVVFGCHFTIEATATHTLQHGLHHAQE